MNPFEVFSGFKIRGGGPGLGSGRGRVGRGGGPCSFAGGQRAMKRVCVL